MLITLTLNPAVDVSMTVDRLIPEHKLHCSQPHYDAGGGGINVAKAVRRLGGDVTALYTAGGSNGLTLNNLLKAADVPYEVIGITDATRECFVLTETLTNQQFRFGTPGPTLNATEAAACLARIETLPPPIDYLVVSGSLPPGLPTNFYAQIAHIAKTRNWRLVLDTAGEPLRAALAEGVFMIKPNLGELARLVGTDRLETDQITAAAMTLIQQQQCEVVVVSLGPRGAMLVTADGPDYVQAPPVQKVSTVGAGDSLVGGMVYALSRGESYADAIRLGVACGTAATMNPGTELFHLADVQRLLTWIDQPHQQPVPAVA
ncbi:1-phosphofructokinase family hexose kinase [Fibrella sp. HMF5335]|uniref:1-phosphofructokinase family hexose kinase n=1 Tax=Fibrella rubiginis TaxID=2817060 RepID=A0A939K3R6_9BACT|nr:1-phosphofructokinase family hexose kinase [Fibrella rubiginis]MBO0935411.1 1-phosphofructokinase family hexose kinase [Fibrella rubiginis]